MSNVSVHTYFAVEIRQWENRVEVARLVLNTASQQGILFDRLDTYDRISVGQTDFIRFATDLKDVSRLMKALMGLGRAVVAPVKGVFVVTIDARTGTVPALKILSVPCNITTYRGTSHPLWAQQFTTFQESNS